MDNLKHLEELITKLHGSTINEISVLHQEVREIRDAMKRVESKLHLHRGMMVAGTVAYGSIATTLTELEARETARDAEVRDLRERLNRLEQK